jgi:hypothetical protein
MKLTDVVAGIGFERSKVERWESWGPGLVADVELT